MSKRNLSYPLKVAPLPSGRMAIMDTDGYAICYAPSGSPLRTYAEDEVTRLFGSLPGSFWDAAFGLARSLAEEAGFQGVYDFTQDRLLPTYQLESPSEGAPIPEEELEF